ncbi:MAG: lytic transglycosylase domain-containing protein, partial [Gammaproteobacteria bacterium]|nr:lytic transglycosylase domain-containing protein [Gammaproteobacteria bacterium]
MDFSRRALLSGTAAGALTMALPGRSYAGAQIEEPLIDSVRTALTIAVENSAPPVPEFSTTEAKLAHLRWLGEMSQRLLKKITDWPTRKAFLQTVWYESRRAGLDVSLVLGLIQVESNFRKWAVSSASSEPSS